ncbi:hypothetical protein [Rhizobium paknamense]|uniref:Transcriptional regulator n=1 Tax=Rhizobium paknamense TaxID=1206817 RepID=A0ABU0IBI1_9HYPH|nr:hypothetical protein [Rhizobium paknamense]MDQ0455577.1 hypothetical protein [Rhizobium paknamense]
MTDKEDTSFDLQGRMNAHRELLIGLLTAGLQGQGAFERLVQQLEADSVFRDGQEDPGAVPNRAFREAGSAAAELKIIVYAAKVRVNASPME